MVRCRMLFNCPLKLSLCCVLPPLVIFSKRNPAHAPTLGRSREKQALNQVHLGDYKHHTSFFMCGWIGSSEFTVLMAVVIILMNTILLSTRLQSCSLLQLQCMLLVHQRPALCCCCCSCSYKLALQSQSHQLKSWTEGFFVHPVRSHLKQSCFQTCYKWDK